MISMTFKIFTSILGHVRCCKILMDNGANTSSRMEMDWTPAHSAAEGGHLPVLKLPIEYGTPIGLKDKYGDTPRIIAARYGHTECVEYLQRYGIV